MTDNTRSVLLFDVGNSAIKFAFATSKGRGKTHIVQSKEDCLSTSFGVALERIAYEEAIHLSSLEAIYISSVVPTLTTFLDVLLSSLFSCDIYHIPKDKAVPLASQYEPKDTLGADRLIAAYAASCFYPDQCVITVDIGTAITIDCICAHTFLGGFILPGLSLILESLQNAAQLPKVFPILEAGDFALGTSTESCMRLGATFGSLAMLESLLSRCKDFLAKPCVTLATGGAAHLFSAYKACWKEKPLFTAIYPDLVLQGLFFLWHQQCNKKSSC
ncbi:MAG: type III pantothenate kinase [Desulfovibrio sp.]|nr:type III pantothenate kinase [Desulfovibrio sp.]MBR4742250.1 type III pantothenate kinase [Desulfovibrio sp.]